MTEPIQVLIADDSSAVRGVLSKVISTDPRLNLVGAASNGAIAVEKATRLDPDVIVLDIEMPVMTGLEAMVEIRRVLPRTPIIMFSTLTEHGADITLEALSKGASDYATKPTNTGTSMSAIDQIRNDLVSKIVGFGSKPTIAATPAPAVSRRAGKPVIRKSTAPSRIDAVIIGSSTGGPAALERVLTSFSTPPSVPIIVVQHMPATFTGVLASRLDKACAFPVVEAAEGMHIDAGSCYIAAGGRHLTTVHSGGRVVARLHDGEKVKSCRPSVDVMFDSAAKTYGGSVLAAVLTGMGDDGLDASGRLAALGVDVIVQDEASSVVWGMPGAISKAGIATECLPIDQIAGALASRLPVARPTSATRVPAASKAPGRSTSSATSSTRFSTERSR